MRLIFILLGILFALTKLTDSVSAESVRAFPAQASQHSVVLLDSSAARSSQQAAKLVAMTQPGYYSTQVVIDSRLNATCNSSLVLRCPPPSNPMPVRLIDFSGQRLDATQVQLSWTTSAEINNDRFAIERSSNPANGFEAIGYVKGKGTSEQNVTYQFTDPNTATDYTYYRLKQIDFDGTHTYSQIIAIKGVLSVLSVTVFPNPGEAHQINFRLSGVGPTDGVSIVLYDAQGRTLHQQQNAVVDADQQLSMPSSLSLSPGRYYVKIRAKNQQAGSSFIVRP